MEVAMTNTTKRRGRPTGSEKDDSKALSAIADMILQDTNLKPTTAMRRFNRNASDADIHRWQDKWKHRKDVLLAHAKARSEERARQKSARTATTSNRSFALTAAGQLAESAFTRLSLGMETSPSVKAMIELHHSPAMSAMREFQESPIMKRVRELHERIDLRAIRELHDSPTIRAIKAFEDSPTMRAFRGLDDSHVMRAARGQF
jgi:hypothetical protein